jgi:sec-independent protein translocase protein TatA
MFRNPLTDAVVILIILLLFFGPKRLPMLSRSIGESIKEFRGGVTHDSGDKELDSAPKSEQTETTSQPDGVKS